MDECMVRCFNANSVPATLLVGSGFALFGAGLGWFFCPEKTLSLVFCMGVGSFAGAVVGAFGALAGVFVYCRLNCQPQ